MNDTKVDAKIFETRTAKYIELRDLIKAKKDEFATALAPYNEALEKLNTWLLEYLNKTGAEHIATASGTVYVNMRTSCSLSDVDAFWTYVVQTKDWSLVDRKANVTGVQAHLKDHDTLPPGVDLKRYAEAGVRRKS